jgi:hypothetical protein
VELYWKKSVRKTIFGEICCSISVIGAVFSVSGMVSVEKHCSNGVFGMVLVEESYWNSVSGMLLFVECTYAFVSFLVGTEDY